MKKVIVRALPLCDFCDKEARWEGQTKLGPWANMCNGCFGIYGSMKEEEKIELIIRPKVKQEISYEMWMSLIEDKVQSQLRVGLPDLPDIDFRTKYETGESALAVSDDMIKNFTSYAK